MGVTSLGPHLAGNWSLPWDLALRALCSPAMPGEIGKMIQLSGREPTLLQNDPFLRRLLAAVVVVVVTVQFRKRLDP